VVKIKHLETTRIGRCGTVVVPARLGQRFGIEEGSPIIAEELEAGILLRPAVSLSLEMYSPDRKAQFLLSNAVDAADYRRAVREVRVMGLDPSRIPHRLPAGH